MKTKVFFILLALAITFGITSCGNSEPKKETKQSVHEHKEDGTHKHVYQCPMNCEKGKTYDKPGKCPVCNGELKEKHEHHKGDGHNH